MWYSLVRFPRPPRFDIRIIIHTDYVYEETFLVDDSGGIQSETRRTAIGMDRNRVRPQNRRKTPSATHLSGRFLFESGLTVIDLSSGLALYYVTIRIARRCDRSQMRNEFFEKSSSNSARGKQNTGLRCVCECLSPGFVRERRM